VPSGVIIMRRISLLLAIVVFAVLWPAVGAVASTTQPFEAQFKETFGRAASKPCSHFLCGEGIVQGFGRATSTLDVTSFEPTETNCDNITFHRVITLEEDGSTLDLTEEGVVCFPGNSSDAPGAQKSFGNPGTFEGTYTIEGGSGVFAGAQGTGTSRLKAAGDSGHSTLSGTITLP
jgi:hypothetical protein